MMSSNDSMGIVFKCLSKGAVDFLVKPIRKNELKNLWQHVWRKCHSVSLYTYCNLHLKVCFGLQASSNDITVSGEYLFINLCKVRYSDKNLNQIYSFKSLC